MSSIMKKIWPRIKVFFGMYVGSVAAIWGVAEASTYFTGNSLKEFLAACRRENAMAHYKALRLVRRRPFAQKNHRGVSENVLGREVFLPVWSLSTRAYALPHPA